MAVETKNNCIDQIAEDSQMHLKACAKNAYSDHKKTIIGDDQITQFIPMVHKVVQRVVTYIKPPLSYEDLVSAGTVGLVKAAQDYDPSHQAEFKTYAYIRIRGSVLDELRNFSLLPANVDKQIRQATQARMELTNDNGVIPTDEQLADKLQITVEKLFQTFKNARTKHFVSMDSSIDDSPSLGASLASASELNSVSFKHSSRSLPLKLSMNAFWVGFPGAM